MDYGLIFQRGRKGTWDFRTEWRRFLRHQYLRERQERANVETALAVQTCDEKVKEDWPQVW